MYVSVYVCIFMYVSVYVCIFMYVSVYVCIIMYVSVYVCIIMYVCSHAYVCFCTYTLITFNDKVAWIFRKCRTVVYSSNTHPLASDAMRLNEFERTT